MSDIAATRSIQRRHVIPERSSREASVLDRLILVPLVLAPLVIAGIFPHALRAFLILDPTLAIGALVIRSRKA
jgi:hypothetical protein